MLPFLNDDLDDRAEALFPPHSRYHMSRIATYVDADGREIRYLRRRFIPPPEHFVQVATHRVAEGDRHDLIAHEHIGNSEASWQIADANGVMKPSDLTVHSGRVVVITLPAGAGGQI